MQFIFTILFIGTDTYTKLEKGAQHHNKYFKKSRSICGAREQGRLTCSKYDIKKTAGRSADIKETLHTASANKCYNFVREFKQGQSITINSVRSVHGAICGEWPPREGCHSHNSRTARPVYWTQSSSRVAAEGSVCLVFMDRTHFERSHHCTTFLFRRRWCGKGVSGAWFPSEREKSLNSAHALWWRCWK